MTFGDLLYFIGFQVEYTLVRIGRGVRAAALCAARALLTLLAVVLRPAVRAADSFKAALTHPRQLAGYAVPLLAAGADAAVLDVLNDLKDVTPAATNARISATHSPENGAEKTEKSERELHYDVKYPYDLSHEEVSDTDKALAAAMEAIARRAILSRRMRPAWDHALLRALSMCVTSNEDIWKEVWTEDERINNASTPMFLVQAVKTAAAEEGSR